MYNFTTTTVVNSKNDFTTGLPLVTSWTRKKDPTVKYWKFKGINSFLPKNVQAVYYAPHTEPQSGQATIDLETVGGVEGDQYRINMIIGLRQASQESIYANDLLFKGKPVSIAFVWKAGYTTPEGDVSAAAATAEALVKSIKKAGLDLYGEKLFNITRDGAKITITFRDEFQKFVKLDLEKFEPKASAGVRYIGEYTVVASLSKDSNAKVKLDNEGVEGFGTYSYILRNLRIPTTARTNIFSVNQNEAPVPGALYDQFTVQYCVDRGVLGNNAVGDKVTSITTHVFFVRTDLLADFYEEDGQEGSNKFFNEIAVECGGVKKVPENTNDDRKKKEYYDDGVHVESVEVKP